MNPLLLRFLPHLLGAGALVAGVLWFGHQRFEAGYGKARGEWEASTQDAASKFADALQDQQTKLVAADAALLSARRSTNKVRESLDEALETPSGAAWGDVVIPDDVRLPIGSARHPSVPRDPAQPDDAVRNP